MAVQTFAQTQLFVNLTGLLGDIYNIFR